MVVSFYGRRIALARHNFLKIPKRHGYIVLVPEIGEDLPQKNPLLRDDKFPDFSNFNIERCIAAIGRQTTEFEEGVNAVQAKLENDNNVDLFKDVLHPLEELYMAMEVTWGIAKTLCLANQTLVPKKHYYNMHARSAKAGAARYVSHSIYEACKNTLNNKDTQLTDQQRRLLYKIILEGRLNAADINDKTKKRFSASVHIVAEKSIEMQEKLEVSSGVFTHTIKDPNDVRDYPEDFLKVTAKNAQRPHEGPWVCNLSSYVVNTIMEYCPDRRVRYKVWNGQVNKGSMTLERMLQTSSALEEIRFRRIEQAKYLGYKSYAEMSMETKTAGSLSNVYSTLDTLLQAARPAQEKEIEELNKFANECGMEGRLHDWDLKYWNRKHRLSIQKHEPQVLREYFPLPKVLSGLFALAQTLFNVKIIERKKRDVWHKDVRLFNVFDLKKSSAIPVGSFYFDPYVRIGEKYRTDMHSAWISGIKSRSSITDTTPLTALIFNFPPPDREKPSLLSFHDIQILFEKFGNMLQQLLTTVDYADLAGNSFVEWDAAFVSDFFMANWAFDPSVIRQISGHHETGQPIPPEMIDDLTLTRKHFAGYSLCKQLYLSHLDLELYSSDKFWVPIMETLWKKYFVLPQDSEDCHVCSFDSIFIGGWAAAYYSHVWSAMLAADLYSAFQEVPANDENQKKELGARYRDTFLALGGTYPASEVFRRFRGRDPSPKALLNNLGLEHHTTDHITN